MNTRKSNQDSPAAGKGGSRLRVIRVRVLFSTASLAVKRLRDRIGEQLDEDANGLLTHSYQQRIEFQFRGERKSTTLVQVAFKPDGKLLITPMGAVAESGGRKRVGLLGALQDGFAQKDLEEVEELVSLAHSYLLLSPAKRQAFLEKSEVSILSAEEIIKLVGKDLLERGDQVIRTFDGKTGQPVQTGVETSVGRDAVTILATYQTLPSGLTTCAQTEIAVPARKLTITLNTMNYQPQ